MALQVAGESQSAKKLMEVSQYESGVNSSHSDQPEQKAKTLLFGFSVEAN